MAFAHKGDIPLNITALDSLQVLELFLENNLEIQNELASLIQFLFVKRKDIQVPGSYIFETFEHNAADTYAELPHVFKFKNIDSEIVGKLIHELLKNIEIPDTGYIIPLLLEGAKAIIIISMNQKGVKRAYAGALSFFNGQIPLSHMIVGSTHCCTP